MRIISGKHKGKKLKEFSGSDVRPTSDKAREALFSILFNKVIGAQFLDLCSGTGAVGLEALSRGASSVTFVDKSKDSNKICDFNLKSIKESADIINCDIFSFLSSTSKKFDIIFFDPPYSFDDINGVLKLVKEREILKPNGIFIYERVKERESIIASGFDLIKTKKYGIAVFDFYVESL
ncbi:MAG: 16S rRNA (guanine(966)-N(2))-methyltransferase RsmD [Clostridia bacterium]|nr:16S rRNA (guanine(966)-N(2))-methyltransferase RsmD [Clostridia bacterium]